MQKRRGIRKTPGFVELRRKAAFAEERAALALQLVRAAAAGAEIQRRFEPLGKPPAPVRDRRQRVCVDEQIGRDPRVQRFGGE